MVVLNTRSISGTGYGKVPAMRNRNNLSAAEVISTCSCKVSALTGRSLLPEIIYCIKHDREVFMPGFKNKKLKAEEVLKLSHDYFSELQPAFIRLESRQTEEEK